ncbi:MAG: phosphohydrolase [Candidatus Omnitrophica bacterium]|nr:phosphohydrolase [Candidatus Omnitrophota bacterium]MBU4346209.1 phosphohydrolase [Candidatus Omnitrophota bacterium]MBU4473357.1 phosphohydrolase [Candidatus Omnitrophota bacterium]MCG2707009.1 phosphohydrolase [Candidatus Omnitrophota bacterium]
MIFKCPGQDDRKVQAETLKCAKCGYKVEIFSDEIKVKCPKCKELVCKERLPSCVDWCKAARECIGEERWRQLKGGNNG